MAIYLLLRAKIKNGQILWVDPIKASKVISAHNNQDVEITIKKPYNQRSKNQNAYYHAVVVEILAEELGHRRKEEMHEILRGKFLGRTMEIAGQIIHYAPSTSDLSTVDFEKYLAEIREWASEDLGIWIPLPNEVEHGR